MNLNDSRMTSISFTVDDDLISQSSMNSTLKSRFKGLKPFAKQYGIEDMPLPNQQNRQIMEKAQMDAYREMNQELFNPFEHKLGSGYIRKQSDLYENEKRRQLQMLKKQQDQQMSNNKNYTIVFHNGAKPKPHLQMAAKNMLGEDGNSPVISDYYNQKFKKKKPMEMIDEDEGDNEQFDKDVKNKTNKKIDNFISSTKKVQKKPLASNQPKNMVKGPLSQQNIKKKIDEKQENKAPFSRKSTTANLKPTEQENQKREPNVNNKPQSQNIIKKAQNLDNQDDANPPPIIPVTQKKEEMRKPPSRPQQQKQVKKEILPRKPQVPKFGTDKKAATKKSESINGKQKYSEVYEGPDRLLVEQLERELTQCPTISFDDIAELDTAKNLLQEAVLLPRLMPQFFQGIRRAMRGILVFGPPGTGKTLLAKAIAKDNVFLNVSASSLASKWKGQSQKMVRLLFEIAKYHSPSVIFFDEIDAIGSRRSENEHESNRKVKTELLVQMDGVGSTENEVFVLAATNRPWDLDEALRRRLQKRIYIPLPGKQGRRKMFDINLKGLKISEKINWNSVVQITKGCSGADICNVCRDAAYMPMRRKLTQIGGISKLQQLKQNEILEEEVSEADLIQSCKKVKPSVGKDDLKKYQAWMAEFGST